VKLQPVQKPEFENSIIIIIIIKIEIDIFWRYRSEFLERVIK